MIGDRDIWRAAHLVIQRHGAEAALYAARRSDELRTAGDVDGGAIWYQILEAVAEVWRTRPTKGEQVN